MPENEYEAVQIRHDADPFKQIWEMRGPAIGNLSHPNLYARYTGHDPCREYNPEILDTTPEQRCKYRVDCNNGKNQGIGGGPP